jgi:hypothetical protein
MVAEELSSRATLVYKFLIPTLWLGGFGAATVAVFVSTADRSSDPEVALARWGFAAMAVAGSLLIYWTCMRAKRVSLQGREFVISNYLREIRVPILDVERVSASILISPELVWLHFRRPTGFGRKVVFLPRFRVLSGFSRHPLAARLGELIRNPDRLEESSPR